MNQPEKRLIKVLDFFQADKSKGEQIKALSGRQGMLEV
jgi:hypothetical protein